MMRSIYSSTSILHAKWLPLRHKAGWKNGLLVHAGVPMPKIYYFCATSPHVPNVFLFLLVSNKGSQYEEKKAFKLTTSTILLTGG